MKMHPQHLSNNAVKETNPENLTHWR